MRRWCNCAVKEGSGKFPAIRGWRFARPAAGRWRPRCCSRGIRAVGAGGGVDALPVFRRRFVVDPAPGRVRCDLEDDYHHMRVVVRHDGGVATGVEAEMIRLPWTTCPGAAAVLVRTFTGVPLDLFAARGEKT